MGGGGGGGGEGWRNKRGGRMRLESGLLLCQSKVTVPLLFEYTEAIGMLITLSLPYELILKLFSIADLKVLPQSNQNQTHLLRTKD